MTTLLSEVRDGKTHRCDATCHRALAPRCKCICGGRLHGREHTGTLKQDYEALLEEKEPHLFDRKTTLLGMAPHKLPKGRTAHQGGDDFLFSLGDMQRQVFGLAPDVMDQGVAEIAPQRTHLCDNSLEKMGHCQNILV